MSETKLSQDGLLIMNGKTWKEAYPIPITAGSGTECGPPPTLVPLWGYMFYEIDGDAVLELDVGILRSLENQKG
jgi:hypothetical protein